MHNQHVYNLVAKVLRENFPDTRGGISNVVSERDRCIMMEQRAQTTRIALAFAYKFDEDFEDFEPLTFLERCSPNNDLYPLTEIWEDAS